MHIFNQRNNYVCYISLMTPILHTRLVKIDTIRVQITQRCTIAIVIFEHIERFEYNIFSQLSVTVISLAIRSLLAFGPMLTVVFLVWCAVSVTANNEFDLFPSLPVGIVDTDNVICKDHSRMYVENLKNLSLWAHQSEFKKFVSEILHKILFEKRIVSFQFFSKEVGGKKLKVYSENTETAFFNQF